MNKKLLSSLITVSLVGTLLVGCTQTSNTGKADGTPKADNKQITLKISWWGSQARHDGTLSVLKKFEEKNPGVKFEPEYSSWDGYWTKLAAESAGNSLPDIIQMDYAYINQYGGKNLLADLNPLVKSGKINLSDVDENSISGGRLGDKLYAINSGSTVLTTIYDPEMFKKAGLQEPSENWTWDEYMNDVLQLKQKAGVYGGGGIYGGAFAGFKYYLRQYGVKFYSDDGKKLGYDDDKYFTDFFGMEMKLASALPSPAEKIEVKSPEDELIVKGKAAIATPNSNQFLALQTAAKRPLKLALPPKDPKQTQQGLFIKPSMFFSIAANSKSVDMAAKFVDYFTNDIDANKILKAERGVPISSKVRDALKASLTNEQKQVFDYVDLATKNSSKIDPPDPASSGQIEKLINSFEEQMLFNKISVQNAAKQFRQQANQILSK